MRTAWVAMDVAAVELFVGIGRNVHAHGVSLTGMASTSWPFLSGLALGWLIVAAGRRSLTTVPGGVVVVISTVTLGMILRVIAGQGTAFAFILVAFGFLGATMLGWRAAALGLRRVRSPNPTS